MFLPVDIAEMPSLSKQSWRKRKKKTEDEARKWKPGLGLVGCLGEEAVQM